MLSQKSLYKRSCVRALSWRRKQESSYFRCGPTRRIRSKSRLSTSQWAHLSQLKYRKKFLVDFALTVKKKFINNVLTFDFENEFFFLFGDLGPHQSILGRFVFGSYWVSIIESLDNTVFRVTVSSAYTCLSMACLSPSDLPNLYKNFEFIVCSMIRHATTA
ncbi:hypothetical protein AVEN_241503-1 [Araneus ventricosus]|uniref:Uncharacterized protein n=1 Tax=Araneus ventricosus TaxID=182803 RepID=A0A4Y2FNZ0_ARAVE|nr:hypothetical protein AVEN_241503-1 [Araneus ventricosus]